MSLSEITSKCFQNGASSSKWASLIQLARKNGLTNEADFASDLSNSILSLFAGYPADPELLAYIKQSFKEGMLTLPTFLITFLQAAKSPSLQNPPTLEVICNLIVDTTLTNQNQPLFRFDESPAVALAILQDAQTLLRNSSPPLLQEINDSSALMTSISNLIVQLLSRVHLLDMSQVPTGQIYHYCSDTSDILTNIRMPDSLRTQISTFTMSMGMLMRDDSKVIQEAQVFQTYQLNVGRGDVLRTNTPTDIITISLFLRYLVSNRASLFGCGNTANAVSILVAIYRWMSWPPATFYTQLYLSAAMCLVQELEHPKRALLWKSFLVTCLPKLLAPFERSLANESVSEKEWRLALFTALKNLQGQTELIRKCDNPPSLAGKDDMSIDSESQKIPTVTPTDLIHTILQYLVSKTNLLPMQSAQGLDQSITETHNSSLDLEALENNLELELYIETKLSPESNSVEAVGFLHRAVDDITNHALFATVVKKRFEKLSNQYEMEGLGHLCKMLYAHDLALDVLALHIRITDIVTCALKVATDFDCESVSDPQTAVEHLGNVILFLQTVVVRYQLGSLQFRLGERVLRPDLFLSTSTIYRAAEVSGEDLAAFAAWFKALFDKNVEGIEDSILRNTKPRTLLKLSASLISSAILQCSEQKMEMEVLKNGVSFFTGPLLNWTLVGVIRSLMREIMYRDFSCPIHLDVLQTLVECPTCPVPVIRLNLHGILSLASKSETQELGQGKGVQATTFNAPNLRRAVYSSLGLLQDAIGVDPNSIGNVAESRSVAWLDSPRAAVREALTAARTGKAPSIDVHRCTQVLGQLKFLKMAWSEIVSSTVQMGDMEVGRRVITYILVAPPVGQEPPLLPVFMCSLMPTLIANIDRQMSAEQAIGIELLISVIASSLTGLSQLEWALRAMDSDIRHPHGQPSVAIARRVAIDLKKSSSPTAATVLQRLSASASFAANFPMISA